MLSLALLYNICPCTHHVHILWLHSLHNEQNKAAQN
jgi:hypothetical protein